MDADKSERSTKLKLKELPRRKRSVSVLKLLLLGIALAIIVLPAVLALQMVWPFARLHEPLEVEIQRGMTFREAGRTLVQHGLMRDPELFVALGVLTGADRTLRPGVYSFEGNLSPWSVFHIIRAGRVKLWRVTILEGDMLDSIGRKLAENKLMSLEEFNRLVRDPEFIASLDIGNPPSLEGYLFPDTYWLEKGLSAKDTLRAMVRPTLAVFTEERLQRARSLGMTTKAVLTLASIIEKEALVDEERPVISAVYHNRLKQGMRLQADPTVVYGVKAMHEGIRYKDLLNDTPYNTYRIKGLPPGPIAAPGLKSIEAALNPADVPYIYFVSNYDGTHTFTQTLTEHRRAVKAFRIRRAEANRPEAAVSDDMMETSQED